MSDLHVFSRIVHLPDLRFTAEVRYVQAEAHERLSRAVRLAAFLVRLDPATGAETAKSRPCLIGTAQLPAAFGGEGSFVSPDEANRALATVSIAPMTTECRGWPTRVVVTFQGKTGEVALDQLRAVDKSRLAKRLGKIDAPTAMVVLDRLGELFVP